MHGLDGGIVLESVLSQLPSDTRLLVATERNLRVKLVGAVDPGGTGAQLLARPEGTVDVLGEDGGGKTVDGVVGLANDVLIVIKLDDNTNGAEDLLLDDLNVVLDIGEDGGLDVVALVAETLTTKVYGGTLLFARLDVIQNTLR